MAALAAVLAVVLAVVLTELFVLRPGRPSGVSGTASEASSLARWNAAAAAAFTPLADRVAITSRYLQQWEAGQLPTDGFVVQVDRTAQIDRQAETEAGRLPPYPGAAAVDSMYRSAAALYVSADQVLIAATGLAPGQLRDQVVLISERVREIGDRTFDQGRVLTAAGLTPGSVPAGSKVELPAEVPDWVAEGLEAGPPLAPPPPAAALYPPLRQGPRPTEPRATWLGAVARLGLPSVAGLSHLSQMGAQAAALERDAAEIGAMPDPAVPHGREASDRLRLSLLTEAEACRAAQAAALVPAAEGGPAASQLRAAAAALLERAAAIPVAGLAQEGTGRATSKDGVGRLT